jgi:hypothetical protein
MLRTNDRLCSTAEGQSQLSPRATGAHDVEDAIDNLPQRPGAWPSRGVRLRQKWLDAIPHRSRRSGNVWFYGYNFFDWLRSTWQLRGWNQQHWNHVDELVQAEPTQVGLGEDLAKAKTLAGCSESL